MITGSPHAFDLDLHALDGEAAHRAPPPWILFRRSAAQAHRIFQHADAGELDLHRVAGLQVFRRVEADADADRRAGRDDVAGIERDAGRDGLDQGRHVEDQQAAYWRSGAARH